MSSRIFGARPTLTSVEHEHDCVVVDFINMLVCVCVCVLLVVKVIESLRMSSVIVKWCDHVGGGVVGDDNVVVLIAPTPPTLLCSLIISRDRHIERAIYRETIGWQVVVFVDNRIDII